MSCCKKCRCQDKVKVIEENLILLRNLLVKEDLLVEGDVLVKGQIIELNPGPIINTCNVGLTPNDVEGGLFSFNDCLVVTQGRYTTSSSRVTYDLTTPNGVYFVINASTVATVEVFSADNIGPSFTVKAADSSENPVAVRFTIRNGILVRSTMISPSGFQDPLLGCTSLIPGTVFNLTTEPNPCRVLLLGVSYFIINQLIGPTTVQVNNKTTGVILVDNYSPVEFVPIVNIDTGSTIALVPRARTDKISRAIIVLENGVVTNFIVKQVSISKNSPVLD